MLKFLTRHKNQANSLDHEQLTEQDKKYLEDNNLKSWTKNREKRTDASIDKIRECKLTRANTLTEDIARLNFKQGRINTVPFSLFRGVVLEKSAVNAMLKEKSTLTFLGSNGLDNTHSTCYAPVAKDFSKYNKQKKKSVVFIIPPNSISLKNDWINIGYHAFLLEDTECLNVPISKSWKSGDIQYIQLASKN